MYRSRSMHAAAPHFDAAELGGAVAEFVRDEPTQPVDPGRMTAEAQRSRYVIDPVRARGLAHCLPRPARLEPDERPRAEPFHYAELYFPDTGDVVVLPVKGMSASGVSLELLRGVPLPTAEDMPVDVELCLGQDIWGQPVRGRYPARVAYRRPGTAGRAGGVSLRWDLTHAGQRNELDRLLTRMKARRKS